jgi:hypothetical protein
MKIRSNEFEVNFEVNARSGFSILLTLRVILSKIESIIENDAQMLMGLALGYRVIAKEKD